MESERATLQQRIVLGVLMLGCVVVGWSLMATTPGNAFGCSVPAVPMVALYAGGAYFILWFAQKAETGGTRGVEGVLGVWKRYVAR